MLRKRNYYNSKNTYTKKNTPTFVKSGKNKHYTNANKKNFLSNLNGMFNSLSEMNKFSANINKIGEQSKNIKKKNTFYVNKPIGGFMTDKVPKDVEDTKKPRSKDWKRSEYNNKDKSIPYDVKMIRQYKVKVSLRNPLNTNEVYAKAKSVYLSEYEFKKAMNNVNSNMFRDINGIFKVVSKGFSVNGNQMNTVVPYKNYMSNNLFSKLFNSMTTRDNFEYIKRVSMSTIDSVLRAVIEGGSIAIDTKSLMFFSEGPFFKVLNYAAASYLIDPDHYVNILCNIYMCIATFLRTAPDTEENRNILRGASVMLEGCIMNAKVLNVSKTSYCYPKTVSSQPFDSFNYVTNSYDGPKCFIGERMYDSNCRDTFESCFFEDNEDYNNSGDQVGKDMDINEYPSGSNGSSLMTDSISDLEPMGTVNNSENLQSSYQLDTSQILVMTNNNVIEPSSGTTTDNSSNILLDFTMNSSKATVPSNATTNGTTSLLKRSRFDVIDENPKKVMKTTKGSRNIIPSNIDSIFNYLSDGTKAQNMTTVQLQIPKGNVTDAKVTTRTSIDNMSTAEKFLAYQKLLFIYASTFAGKGSSMEFDQQLQEAYNQLKTQVGLKNQVTQSTESPYVYFFNALLIDLVSSLDTMKSDDSSAFNVGTNDLEFGSVGDLQNLITSMSNSNMQYTALNDITKKLSMLSRGIDTDKPLTLRISVISPSGDETMDEDLLAGGGNSSKSSPINQSLVNDILKLVTSSAPLQNTSLYEEVQKINQMAMNMRY